MKKNVNKYCSGNVILPQQKQEGSLVLGDCNSAVDLAILKPNKVKTIISIGLEAKPNKNKVPEEIAHHVYDIHDNKQQKLPIELIDEVVAIIEEGRKRGGVLIHCYAGVSRSSTFTIAYIMNKKKLSYDKAKEKAKKYRPCVHPGDGFVRQLQFYEKVLAKRQEERLAQLKMLEPKQGQKVVKQQQKVEDKPVQKIQKVKRGVKGAVKSAEQYSPQKVKTNLNISQHAKIEQKVEEQLGVNSQTKAQDEKSQKLPLIVLRTTKNDLDLSRYQKSSSRAQIKRSMDKIEGRPTVNSINITSIRNIYGNKVKIM